MNSSKFNEKRNSVSDKSEELSKIIYLSVYFRHVLL